MMQPYQSHSQTSREAFNTMQPRLNQIEQQILKDLAVMKDHGLTGDEIAQNYDIAPGTASARLASLHYMKLIKKSHDRRETRASNDQRTVMANVWKLPEYVEDEADTKIASDSFTDNDGKVWERPDAETYANSVKYNKRLQAENLDLKRQIEDLKCASKP